MLKNKSGFVGIGAYAGNQLLPFYKTGYPCLFANTATTDLDSLTSMTNISIKSPEEKGVIKTGLNQESCSGRILTTLSMR